jgi:hypothetical protein
MQAALTCALREVELLHLEEPARQLKRTPGNLANRPLTSNTTDQKPHLSMAVSLTVATLLRRNQGINSELDVRL